MIICLYGNCVVDSLLNSGIPADGAARHREEIRHYTLHTTHSGEDRLRCCEARSPEVCVFLIYSIYIYIQLFNIYSINKGI